MRQPIAIVVADCVVADTLLDQIIAAESVPGDKGYDTNTERERIEAKGATSSPQDQCYRIWIHFVDLAALIISEAD